METTYRGVTITPDPKQSLNQWNVRVHLTRENGGFLNCATCIKRFLHGAEDKNYYPSREEATDAAIAFGKAILDGRESFQDSVLSTDPEFARFIEEMPHKTNNETP